VKEEPNQKYCTEEKKKRDFCDDRFGALLRAPKKKEKKYWFLNKGKKKVSARLSGFGNRQGVYPFSKKGREGGKEFVYCLLAEGKKKKEKKDTKTRLRGLKIWGGDPRTIRGKRGEKFNLWKKKKGDCDLRQLWPETIRPVAFGGKGGLPN